MHAALAALSFLVGFAICIAVLYLTVWLGQRYTDRNR